MMCACFVGNKSPLDSGLIHTHNIRRRTIMRHTGLERQRLLEVYGHYIPQDQRTESDMFYAFTRMTERQRDSVERKQHHYPYIAFEPYMFVKHINELLSFLPSQPHFIDVGCGIGDKLLLAQEFCGIANVSGIEYNAISFAMANESVGHIAHTLVQADAITYDFSAFNLIYMYCPI